eukprot:4455614-Pyramimonas_sp.AAC.1
MPCLVAVRPQDVANVFNIVDAVGLVGPCGARGGHGHLGSLLEPRHLGLVAQIEQVCPGSCPNRVGEMLGLLARSVDDVDVMLVLARPHVSREVLVGKKARGSAAEVDSVVELPSCVSVCRSRECLSSLSPR